MEVRNYSSRPCPDHTSCTREPSVSESTTAHYNPPRCMHHYITTSSPNHNFPRPSQHFTTSASHKRTLRPSMPLNARVRRARQCGTVRAILHMAVLVRSRLPDRDVLIAVREARFRFGVGFGGRRWCRVERWCSVEGPCQGCVASARKEQKIVRLLLSMCFVTCRCDS